MLFCFLLIWFFYQRKSEELSIHFVFLPSDLVCMMNFYCDNFFLLYPDVLMTFVVVDCYISVLRMNSTHHILSLFQVFWQGQAHKAFCLDLTSTSRGRSGNGGILRQDSHLLISYLYSQKCHNEVKAATESD